MMDIGFPLYQLLLTFAGVIVATVLRTFTGFGFALAAVPIFSTFMAPAEAVVLTASLSFALALISVRIWWGIFSVREVLPLIALAGVGTVLGAVLLTRMSGNAFQLAAGFAVLLACLGIVISRPSTPWKSPTLTCGAGLLSGLMNGALAIPGPPMIIYALLTEFEPRRSRALLMMFFSASSLLALASYSAAGLVTWNTLWYALLALPALYLGDRLGNALYLHYGGEFYRRVALLSLAVMGVAVIARAL